MSVYGDYVESLNLFKMAIGEAAGAEYEFAKRAQDLLGIDLTQWMQAQGVFNALASGFGVASDKASLMSRNLTQLAYDISSFYNITVEDAIQKVQSGFAGQIRPVRNLGYDLSQARLEAIALANGIDEEVKSMTQAEKSQLRYIALMTQLTEVQGDLARTLDSPTNQMRLLNAQLDQMQRSIGLVLLPLLNKIIPYLNAIFRVIKMIAEEIAAMFGYTLPALSGTDFTSNISMGADELEEDLEDANSAAKELKNTLASFDQINLITSSSKGNGGGTGGSTSTGGLNLDLPSYDFLGNVTENQAQKIAEGMMQSLRPYINTLKELIKFVVDHLDLIKRTIEIIAVTTIGKKLLGSLLGVFTTSKKEMEDLQGILKGFALITIGFQFSYEGGKDIGKGNLLQGVMQSAFGTGIAAIGGKMVFGTAGMVISAIASLVITFKGYLDGKAEALQQECHDIFFAIRDDAKSLDEVKESWEKFCDSLTNPEVLEKVNVADELQGNVEGIGKAIGELRTQYITGNIIATSYAENLIQLYGELETAVAEHMKGVDEAIIASLQGPFGLYMQARGYDVQKYIDTITTSTDNVQKRLEQNRLKLQEYNHYIEQGISVDHYRKKIDEILAENELLYESMGDVSGQTTTVFDSFKDIKINMEDLQPFKDAMAEIEKTYSDTVTNIDKELEIYRTETNKVLTDPDATEAQKQYAREVLGLAEQYAKDQKQVLNDAYIDLIQSFENQAVLNWSHLVDLKGLDVANNTMKDVFGELETVFNDAYGTASQERAETYFSKLVGLQGKYANAIEGYSFGFANASKKQVKTYKEGTNEVYKSMLDIAIKFGNTSDTMISAVGKMADAGQRDWDRYGYYVAINTDKMNSKLPEIPKAMQRNLLETTGIMDAQKDNFGIKSAMLMGQVSLALADSKNTAKNNLKHTLDIASAELVTSDIQAKYKNNANTLLGSMVGSLSDPMGRVKKAISDTLTSNQPEMEKLGKNLGLGIAKGMDSVSGDAETSTSKLTKRMGKPFNQFGSDLYDYMNTMTAGIVAIWNSIEISTGKATLSSKLKIPKWAMKGYATGGFPTSADFFYANENGVPEYVGTMGGRTAVANNQEITKGVADAVYKAIKDTGIANDVKKIASKDGKVVFAPSEQAGKVMQQSVNMYNSTGGRY